MTVISVSNTRELNAALASVRDGDRIELRTGSYNSLRLADRDFMKGITVTSADPDKPAVITNQLYLSRVSGVTIEDIDVVASALAPKSGYVRAMVYQSENVVLRDMTVAGHVPTASEGADPTSAKRLEAIAGYGYDRGISLRGSEGVTIERIEIEDVRVALTLANAKDVFLTDSEIHHVREGVNMDGVEDVTVTGSYFHDLKGFRADHVDMIQYWGSTKGLTVADNFFLQPENRPSQTIFGFASGKDDVATDFTISGNTIFNGRPNGIRLGDVDGAIISENVLLPNGDSVPWGRYPAIRLPGAQNVEVTDNVLIDRNSTTITGRSIADMKEFNITESGNMLLSHSRSSPFYWGNLPELGQSDGKISNADRILSMKVYAAAIQEETIGAGAPVVAIPEGPAKVIGTASANQLKGSGADEHLQGLGGNDKLYGKGGSDILEGGAGADSFSFDFRFGSRGDRRDVILDLDFSEEDRLGISAARGTFDNSVDPGNRLIVLNGGGGVQMRSLADIAEVIMGGHLDYAESKEGNLLLSSDLDPHWELEIASLTASDLFQFL